MKKIRKITLLLLILICAIIPVGINYFPAAAEGEAEIFTINGKKVAENEYETMYEAELLAVEKDFLGKEFDLFSELTIIDGEGVQIKPIVINVFRDGVNVSTKKINTSAAGSYSVEYYAQSTTYKVVFFKRTIVIYSAPKLYLQGNLLNISETYADGVICGDYQSETLHLKENAAIPDTSEKYDVYDYFGNKLLANESVITDSENQIVAEGNLKVGEVYRRVYRYTDGYGNILRLSEDIRYYGEIVVFKEDRIVQERELAGRIKKGNTFDNVLPEYKIEDSFGNTLEVVVENDGGLNTQVPGTYLLSCYVTDAAGNRLDFIYSLTVYENTALLVVFYVFLCLAIVSVISLIVISWRRRKWIFEIPQGSLLTGIFAGIFGILLLIVLLIAGIFCGFLFSETETALFTLAFMLVFGAGALLTGAYAFNKRRENDRGNH